MDGMNQILSILQKKYRRMDMILTITKELEQVVSTGDETSLGIILETRQNEMNGIDQLDRELKGIKENMPLPLQQKINQMLHPASGETVRLENPLETNIFDTNKRIIRLVEKIIDLDRVIRDRMKRKK
ncbi:hypothetical protein [Sinanaerobacter sp. ZZT-01]|uniref:hypothetical protein n=1 Tax=Sinanaerobacter sp. ZZT-01 TaxID=3111540 RepID=UPI002D76B53C|nr:hypothetical protein [Sinanaerobacter sp. ZZT-01]WRR93560.1 hypothetical protein U5921_00090 [Sinanaerobacter sp. ZZT-01]